jgi:hypothetical protein
MRASSPVVIFVNRWRRSRGEYLYSYHFIGSTGGVEVEAWEHREFENLRKYLPDRRSPEDVFRQTGVDSRKLKAAIAAASV